MNLRKKKALAKRALGIGAERIIFTAQRIEEIKEAITKQDIKDLVKDGAIRIKELKGRKIVVGRNIRRGPGKIKMKVKNRKRGYVILTRKFRAYAKELKKQGKISNEIYLWIRKQIKSSMFKSKAHLKEQLKEMKIKI